MPERTKRNRKMRVFNSFTFDISGKVKFPALMPYIVNMISELGLSYRNIGFRIHDGAVERLMRSEPETFSSLEKYFVPAEKNEQGTGALLTSFRENWTKGDIYIGPGDSEAVFGLFVKIPKPYRLDSCILRLDGIDWYGGGDISPAVKSRAAYRLKIPTTSYLPFMCSGITLKHDSYAVGNVTVEIETTAEPEPRGTQDILRKLEPYLGDPVFSAGSCMFAPEEYERFAVLRKSYEKRMSQLLSELGAVSPYKETAVFGDMLMPKVCGKQMTTPYFKKIGFEPVKHPRKGSLPGIFEYVRYDAHNFRYRARFNKLPHNNILGFHFQITGCNFDIIPFYGEARFAYKTKEEAEEILQKLAEYTDYVYSHIGDDLASDFGDTPAWYKDM